MTKTMVIMLISGLLLCISVHASDKKSRNAAIVGAGVGLVTDGVCGAAKGAVYGGAAGAVTGQYKDKK